MLQVSQPVGASVVALADGVQHRLALCQYAPSLPQVAAGARLGAPLRICETC
jgi:hypothetical protein